MNVCITGAGGLIGRSLIAKLITRPDIKITGFDIIPTPENIHIRWLQGNLQHLEDCNRLVKNQDIIIHLAHTNSPLTSDQNVVEDVRLNLIPTLNLLKAIKLTGEKPHFIYPSSGGAVYGASMSKQRFTEDDCCLPMNSYGIQKLAAEHYIRVATLHGEITATVFRIANAYGWLLPPNRTQGFIGTAITRVLTGKPVRLFGNPENVRDYIHIDDIVDAILLSLSQYKVFDCYNVGTGIGTSVIEVIEIIERLVGHTIDQVFEVSEFSNFLPDEFVLDTQKIQTKFGWQSRVSLEEGIQRMLNLGHQDEKID